MTSTTAPSTPATASDGSLAPLALGPGEGEHRWFFGGLTTIKADGAATGGRMMLTEQRAPRGGGSPLHIHHNEDEWFYVLEGELTIWVAGETIVAPAGAFVFGPRDVPHTFVVSSDEARFLLVTQAAGFEGVIRALGEPAPVAEIPPAPTAPPDMGALAAVAEAHGLEIIGPPGIPD
ncbi:quercetin 2,3-dioxygenase [Paraconexibacter antarcticus]|uniref:Quercetin 2,3-dioxygenase n=1 Tax=Paraconexibacter antarcticus TaxID=2949664 RepID=A0ABY5DV45_9ACTN|nr:quercetin 2,3-dioxygenase [Paraconexibacter antarcticus]UTI65888.1 quercetin 2,3-dioxygenase [Paraconexibacter antarcticus]